MSDDFDSISSDDGSRSVPFAAGAVVAGKYRIDKVINSGGMGVILVGKHLQLDQRVAIKVLRPSALENAEAVERFDREARAAARIHSEHVARVLDVGRLDTGAPYMVMEYLKGSDLSKLLKDKGPLSLDDALEYVLQACEALAEAHAVGIVHRDIKPANLFLTHRADGSTLVKVLDFGISKVISPLDNSDTAEGLTKTSMMIGSPQYMSPEQLKSARKVDARADIWALGVVLFKLLTGKNAFVADTTPELCVAILLNPPRSLSELNPDVSPGLECVVIKCLEKEPDNRYANIGELAQALAQYAPARAAISVDRIVRVINTPRELHSVPPEGMMRSDVPTASASGKDPPQQFRLMASKSMSTVSGSVASTDTMKREAGIPARRTGLLITAGLLVLGVIGAGVYTVPRMLKSSAVAPPPATVALPAPSPVVTKTDPPPVAPVPTQTAIATSSAKALPGVRPLRPNATVAVAPTAKPTATPVAPKSTDTAPAGTGGIDGFGGRK